MKYRTQQGDMWDAIAYRALGDCSYTAELIRLNASHSDVYVFDAGIELELPEAKKKDPIPLPPWKAAKARRSSVADTRIARDAAGPGEIKAGYRAWANGELIVGEASVTDVHRDAGTNDLIIL